MLAREESLVTPVVATIDRNVPALNPLVRAQLCNYVHNVRQKSALAHSHSDWYRTLHHSSCWDHVRSATLLQKHMLPDMHPLYSVSMAKGKTAVFSPDKDERSLDKVQFILNRATRLRALNIHIDNFWFRDATTRGQQVMHVLQNSFESNAFRYFRHLTLKIEMSTEILVCVLPVLERLMPKCSRMEVSLMSPKEKPCEESLAVSRRLLDTLNSKANCRCLKSLTVLGNVNEQHTQISELVKGQKGLATICLMNGSTDCLTTILSQVPSATVQRLTLLVCDAETEIAQERLFTQNVPANVWHNVQQLTVTYQPPRARSSADWCRWFDCILNRCPKIEQVADHLSKIQPHLTLNDFISVLKKLMLNAVKQTNDQRPTIEVNLFKPRGIKVETDVELIEEQLIADKDIQPLLKTVNYFGYTLTLTTQTDVVIEVTCNLQTDVQI